MTDWKPGDMVVCITNGPWCDGARDEFIRGPRRNETVTVTGVGSEIFEGHGFQTLYLKEWPSEEGWEASVFCRIEPPAQTETVRELETV